MLTALSAPSPCTHSSGFDSAHLDLSLTLCWNTMQEINANQLLNPLERVEHMLRKIQRKPEETYQLKGKWCSFQRWDPEGRKSNSKDSLSEGWQLCWAARNHLEGQQLWTTLLSPTWTSCSHSSWAEQIRKISPLSKQDHSFSWAQNRVGSLDPRWENWQHCISSTGYLASTNGRYNRLWCWNPGYPANYVRKPLPPPKVDLISARNRLLTSVSHQFQDSADSCLPQPLYCEEELPLAACYWVCSHSRSPRLLISETLYNAG